MPAFAQQRGLKSPALSVFHQNPFMDEKKPTAPQPPAAAPTAAETNALIEQRKTKLAALRAKGINPFMNKFTPDTACGDARARFEAGTLAEGAPVAIAGRLTAHRDMGKSQFVDLKDQSGSVQVYAQKQALGTVRRPCEPSGHAHGPLR